MASDAARKFLAAKVKSFGDVKKESLVDAIMYTMDEGYADEIVEALSNEDIEPCDDCGLFLCDCDEDDADKTDDPDAKPAPDDISDALKHPEE